MSIALFAATLALSQEPLREITFLDGMFTIKGPEGQTKVSIKPGFQAMNTATGRLWLPLAGTVLTFDQNGVGFRRNNRVSYAAYTAAATSDKFFTKEQIDEINRDVANGKKKLEVSAVSGWEKIGDSAILLLRWDQTDGKPWLEVLMKFEFPGGKPKVTTLGRMTNFTLATGRVNDKLLIENNKLFAVTTDSKSSSLETYNLETSQFSKFDLGVRFTDAKLAENSLSGMGLQKTPAGTTIVSIIEREPVSSRQVAEIRGSIQGLYSPSMLLYAHENRRTLTNLASGAEITIPKDCGIESVAAGMLLWTPKQNPQVAALYSAGSFRTLARWSKP
jgi:hypothetical protein